MDQLGKNLGGIIRKSAEREITRTPRVSVPPPPVLTLNPAVRETITENYAPPQWPSSVPDASAYTNVAASLPAYVPPPPPPQLQIAAELGRNVRVPFEQSARMPSTGLSVGAPAMPFANVGKQVSRKAKETQPGAWGVYDVDGVNVAMPVWIANRNGFALTSARTTTDPDEIGRLESNHIAYTNVPPEVRSKIKMPEEIDFGREVRAQANRIKETSPDALIDFATKVTGQAMKHGVTTAWNKQHEYALIRDNVTGDTELVKREEVPTLTANGTYTVVTDAVSAEEADRIRQTEGFDSNREMIENKPQPDSTVATAQLDDATSRAMTEDMLGTAQNAIRNKQLLDTARSQDVTVIGDKAYPKGITEPVLVLSVTGLSDGSAETSLEDMPSPAPDGWVWVQDDEQAWLMIEQRDRDGNLILPDGVRAVQTRDELMDNPINNTVTAVTDPVSSAVETILSKGVGWVMDQTADIPILGDAVNLVITAASRPGQENIDSITRLVLYPDDTNKVNQASQPFRLLPPVQQYEDWITANPDAARNAYENGYDSNDDGEPDLYEGDAVAQLWHDEELAGSPGGATTWLLFMLVTDPLTYVAGAGVVGKVGSRSGRAIRMQPGANLLTRGAGRAIEVAGRGVEIGARATEDVADLGARYVLAGGAYIVRKVGVTAQTGAAKVQADADIVQPTVTNIVNRKVSPFRLGSMGALVATEDGLGVRMELDSANAPTTGTAARPRGNADVQDVSPDSLGKMADEGHGFEEGDVIDTPAGTFVRQGDEWEHTAADGTTTAVESTAAIPNVVEQAAPDVPGGIPKRWLPAEPAPGRQPRYIDTMNAGLYRGVSGQLTDFWNDAVAAQKAANTPGTDVANPQHLKVSNIAAWRTMETAQAIDPSYTRAWERNGGGDTRYMLSEVFQRASWPTASRYWDAMTGGGSTVPLRNGMPYRGTVATFDLSPLGRGKVKPARIRIANDTVDAVYARLRWHPEDIYNPDFQVIARQAAELDYDLRQRGMRDDGDFSYPPITDLIPEDVVLLENVRAMSDYTGQPMRVEDELPGEHLGRVTIDAETELGVDIYQVVQEQVPPSWVDYWTQREPDWAAEEFWARGDVTSPQTEGYTVFAPEPGRVVMAAEETALARDLIPAERHTASQPVDHVAAAEGIPDPVLAPEPIAAPEAVQTPPQARTEPAPQPAENPQQRRTAIGNTPTYLLDMAEPESFGLHPASESVTSRLRRYEQQNPTTLSALASMRRALDEIEYAIDPSQVRRRAAPDPDPVFMDRVEAVIRSDPKTKAQIQAATDELTSAAREATAKFAPYNGGNEMTSASLRQIKAVEREVGSWVANGRGDRIPPDQFIENIRNAEARSFRSYGTAFDTSPTVGPSPYDIWTPRFDSAVDEIIRNFSEGKFVGKTRNSDALNALGGAYSDARSVLLSNPDLPAQRLVEHLLDEKYESAQRWINAYPDSGPWPPAVGEFTRFLDTQIRETVRRSERIKNDRKYLGSRLPEGAKLPEPTGETILDPTGTVEMPVYRTVDPAPEPTVTASPEAKSILDNINAMDVDSPEYRRMLAKHGGESPATHKVARTNKAVQVDDAYERRWLGRAIEPGEEAVLTAHPFPDGETFMDRVTRYFTNEGNAEGWRNHFAEYENRAIDKAWGEYEAHLIENVYPSTSKKIGRQVAKLPAPVRTALEKVGVFLKRILLDPFDWYTRYRAQRMLHGWPKLLHYPATQWLGNAQLALFAGDINTMFRTLNPVNVKRGFSAVKSGTKVVKDSNGKVVPQYWWRQAQDYTPAAKLNRRLGIASAPETTNVYRGLHMGSATDYLIGQKFLATKLGVPGRALSKWAGTRLGREIGAGADVAYRDALELTTRTALMKHTYLPDFRNQTINRLVGWGMDKAEAIRLWDEFWNNTDGWAFSHDDLVRHYSPVVGRGRAERIGRDWSATQNKATKEVRAEIRRRGFAQGETRADVILRRFLPFHFFQSRQTWFLLNQMAKHPFLINLYMNFTEELEELSKDWPPYMQGWLKIMVLPGGRMLFLKPHALLSTYTMFVDQETKYRGNSGEEEEDGPLPKWVTDGYELIEKYTGINPVIADGFNLTGMLGDIWVPDLLGINREANDVTLLINTLRAYGVIGDDPTPTGNLYSDLMGKARQEGSRLNPIAETVEARSSEQTMDREIRAIMMDQMKADGIDPESPEGQRLIAEAEADTDSPAYQRALKTWIAGEWAEEGARFVLGPFRPRTRQMNSEGEDLNTNMTDEERRLVNTPEPQVTIFRTQAANYYDIGDARTRKLADIWREVAFGTPVGNITVDGVTYTPEQIAAMSDEQRMGLADGMLAELGTMDDVHNLRDERNKFLAQPENRDLAQYDTWSEAVSDYEGGPEQYWADLIEGNPTAAQYYTTFIEDETDPAARERLMTGHNAFFAIMGWDTYVYDKPVEAYGSRQEIWDPVGVANTAPKPIPYEEPNKEYNDEVRSAPVFVAEMEQYDTAFRNKAVEYGYPYDVYIPNMPSKTRTAIEKDLADEGIYEPKAEGGLEDYFEWANEQMANGVPPDQITPEAYLASNQDQYYESMPRRATEKINTPAPLPAPDKYGNTAPAPVTSYPDFWTSVFNLVNQHNHERYKDPWGAP